MPLCIHRFPGVDGVFEFTHDAGKARKDKIFFFGRLRMDCDNMTLYSRTTDAVQLASNESQWAMGQTSNRGVKK